MNRLLCWLLLHRWHSLVRLSANYGELRCGRCDERRLVRLDSEDALVCAEYVR